MIYPFEISDHFLAEFQEIAERLLILLVNFVDNNIKVIFRSKLYDRLSFLNEMQFDGDIKNLFYRHFDNIRSQPINVLFVMPDPPQ